MSGPVPPARSPASARTRCSHAIFPHLPGRSRRARSAPATTPRVVAAPGGSVLATTDALVRQRDWRDDWSTGADVGAKVVAQNFADIAAMGGVPTGLLVTLVAEPATSLAWVERLRPRGWARRHGRPGSRSSAVTCPRRRRGPWSCRSPRWGTWTAVPRCCARGRGSGTSSRWPAAWGARRPGWLLLQRSQAGRAPRLVDYHRTADARPRRRAGGRRGRRHRDARRQRRAGPRRRAHRPGQRRGHRPRPRR